MSNPFNPLDWVKNAQNWFSKTEKSSGFRPYLIYLILVFGVSITFSMLFSENSFIINSMIFLIIGSCFLFIVLYFIKSLQEPNFCRSESHVQKVMKIEMEKMGSDSHQIEEHEIEEADLIEDDSTKQISDTSAINSGGEK